MSKLTEQHQGKSKKSFSLRNSCSSSSSPDPFASTSPQERPDSVISGESSEVKRLKKQLELTTERMAQMDLEINQFRLAQRTVEQAIGSPFPVAQDLGFRPDISTAPPRGDAGAALVQFKQPHNGVLGAPQHNFHKHEGFLHTS